MNLKNSWRNLALTTSVLLLGLMSYQMVNDPKVGEVREERRRKAQEYHQLYDKAVACVKQDEINGLSWLEEMDKLYQRAGVSINYDSKTGKIVGFPRLTREKLVKNCKTEGKLK